MRTFSRRYAEASLRLRGFFSAALRAASASLRLGVGRPLPPGLGWGAVAAVCCGVSDLVRRNTGTEPHSGLAALVTGSAGTSGRARLGVVPGRIVHFIGAGPDGVVTRGDIGWLT